MVVTVSVQGDWPDAVLAAGDATSAGGEDPQMCGGLPDRGCVRAYGAPAR